MLNQCRPICLISVYIYINHRCWPHPAHVWEDVSHRTGPKQPVAGHSEGLAVHSVSVQCVNLWASASFDHEETATVASGCYRGKKRDFIHWCFISVLSKEFGCGSNTFWNANYTPLCHPTSLIHDMLFFCKSVIAYVLCTCVVMVSDCFLILLLNRRSTLPFPGSQEHYEVCGFHSQSIQHWLQLFIRCLYYVPLGVHPEFGEESVWRGKWCVPWRRMGAICWIIHRGLKHSRVCRIRGHPHHSKPEREALCEPCCILLEHCKNMHSYGYARMC